MGEGLQFLQRPISGGEVVDIPDEQGNDFFHQVWLLQNPWCSIVDLVDMVEVL